MVTPTLGKKKALIIAISEYEHYRPLEMCKKDGQLIYETLTKIGFEIPENRKIIGKVDNHTFEKAVKDFFRGNHVNSEDTLLFYYSGHGTPSGEGDYYFVTSETDYQKPDVDGFDYDILTKISKKSKSKKIVKIIDCCYSGALGKSDEGAGAITGKNLIGDKFETEGEGNYVIASSLGTQSSYGRKNNSCSEFTYHINNGLNGLEKSSVNKDGYVTPHSLGKYAWEKMKNLEQDQRPINNTQATGDVFLAKYPKLATIQSNSTMKKLYSEEEKKAIKRKTNITIITSTAIVAAVVILGFGIMYPFDELENYSFVAKLGTEFMDEGQLLTPNGVVVDSEDNVYVVDSGNHRIQKFEKDGKFMDEWGSKGREEGEFRSPIDIAVDSEDNVYVTDTENKRVQKFDKDGKFMDEWGGFDTVSNDGGFDTVSNDGGFGPLGITVDSEDNVYVTDIGSHLTQKFDKDGNPIAEWGSGGITKNQKFASPRSMAVDSADNVYVVDTLGNNIEKFDKDGNPIAEWGSGGITKNQKFASPIDIAVDSEDNVYVTGGDSQNYLQKFDSNGNLMDELIVNDSNGEEFYNTSGISMDSNDNVYVTDKFNNNIQSFDKDGNPIAEWGNSYLEDKQFDRPMEIAVDSADNVYVTDVHNLIQKFDKEGKFITKWNNKGIDDKLFNNPNGIAIDSSDNVYVTDVWNNNILKFDIEGNLLTWWGNSDPNNDGFGRPSGIAVDSADNVYVVLDKNIVKFILVDSCPSNTHKIKLGICRVNDWEIEMTNWAYASNHITVDSADNVYVVDTMNNMVQKFDKDGKFITEVNSNGVKNKEFKSPIGITVDSADNVYVVDIDYHSIQKFDKDGKFITEWGGEGYREGEFLSPWGITVDSADRIYITDPERDIVSLFAKG